MPLNLVETDLNLTRLTSSVGNWPACSSWHTRHIILAEAGLSPTRYKRFIGHIILAEAGLSPTRYTRFTGFNLTHFFNSDL